MKRVLIISPCFPPVNAADIHRVRQSLPYFRELGWEPVVIAVDEAYVASYSVDPLLLKTIPGDIEIHRIKAFDIKYTKRLGLGSLSMRSFLQFRRKGDELLRTQRFDLVYFSTTAFHVMALGPRWKRKFKVPFVVDIQDPWRNDFYLSRPRKERPPKFFLAYNIDKKLEASTIPHADGIISVSQGYCDTFKERYPSLGEHQFKVIPFGASEGDFRVMEKYVSDIPVKLPAGKINLVYVGRGGHDMKLALQIIFEAFKKGIREDKDVFSKMHFTFVGTSYAMAGQGTKTIEPTARIQDIQDYVTEITDRIPYFDTLYLLRQADALVVPGSTDKFYTASKIYPYLLAGKPLLAVFYKASSVINVLQQVGCRGLVIFDDAGLNEEVVERCYCRLKEVVTHLSLNYGVDRKAFEPYTAFSRTREQADFFDQVIETFGKAGLKQRAPGT